MNHRILLISLFLLPVVFNSGCLSGMSPEDIAKMSSEVKSFINEYPNARVTASLLKSDYIASIIGEIREDCGAQMDVTDYWKVNVYDPSTNITVTVWIEDAGRKAVCVVKKGGPCQEKWACSEWSGCVNGTASRTCTDSNGCNTTKNRPEQMRACNVPPGQPPTVEIPKNEKTNFKFFVMSYCPYANQVEAYLKDVYAELGDKADWEPHYVIYSNYSNGGPDYCIENGLYCSMHGIQELNEDLRELCIWKYETHDKFFDFVTDVNTACTSSNVDTCWEAVASNYGIDTERIKQCQNEEGTALAEAEYELGQKYKVVASPTILINEVEYSGIRSVEAYKAAICSGFISPPPEC